VTFDCTIASIPALPQLDVDSPEFTNDPLAAFDALRPGWAAQSARGVEVFSYRAVEAIYRSANFTAGVTKLIAEMGLDSVSLSGSGANLQSNDGPDHDRLRKVVSRWFTPSAVARLEPRVAELTGRLLDPLTEAGGGDLMAGVARHVPGPVFCWMIGAPDELGERVFALSETLLLAFEGDAANADAISGAALELSLLIDEIVIEKRSRPDDDLLTVLIDAADRDEISPDDVHSLMFELLGASTDNTAHSVGLAAAVLGGDSERWALLRDAPALVPNALEECARVEPRIRCDSAWAPDGADLLGLEIPPGTMVWQHTAGAHHDPKVFPDPYRVDLTREQPVKQLNFGVGRHFCLGAALARMELRTIFATMLDQWSEFAVEADAAIDRTGGSASVGSLRFTCTSRVSLP